MGTATTHAPVSVPLRRVRPGALAGTTAQTPGMARAEALSGRTVGAQHLWMGKTVAPAGKVSAVHHHGEGETGIYLLRGCVTLFFGEGLRERLEVQAGDFAFAPAWAIDAEGNLSGRTPRPSSCAPRRRRSPSTCRAAGTGGCPAVRRLTGCALWT